MATFSISGNVGGTAAFGAKVELLQQGQSVPVLNAADSNGNYTFSGLADLTNYVIRAFSPDATHAYRSAAQASINGANVTGINLSLVLLNAPNS